MITNIYYSLAIFAYSIFLIQFFISLFGGGDTDIDIDVDGDGLGDLSWGDIFSFKGFIHFLMGFAGWLSIKSYQMSVQWYDYIISILLGFAFVLIIFFVGKLLLKLKHEPIGSKEKDFDGHSGVITTIGENNTYSVMMPEFNGFEIRAYSNEQHNIGDEVKIKLTQNGRFFIE